MILPMHIYIVRGVTRAAYLPKARTGVPGGPSITDVMSVLGHEVSSRRIRQALGACATAGQGPPPGGPPPGPKNRESEGDWPFLKDGRVLR